MPTGLWINGISGKMGEELKLAVSKNQNFKLLGGTRLETTESEAISGINSADMIIDFSSPSGTTRLLTHLSGLKNKTLLFCTTGLSQDTIQNLKKLGSHHRVMLAPNTSLGILLFSKILGEYSQILFESNFDIEVTETHHRYKADSPSGTALFLRNSIDPQGKLETCSQYKGQRTKNQIGMHALRGGGVAGEHSVRFISDSEELEISHRAFNRSLFASGALVLARLLESKNLGFYDFGNITTSELLATLKS